MPLILVTITSLVWEQRKSPPRTALCSPSCCSTWTKIPVSSSPFPPGSGSFLVMFSVTSERDQLSQVLSALYWCHSWGFASRLALGVPSHLVGGTPAVSPREPSSVASGHPEHCPPVSLQAWKRPLSPRLSSGLSHASSCLHLSSFLRLGQTDPEGRGRYGNIDV